MNKTPVGRKFINELVRVNDQLCFSALLHHEFEAPLSQYAKSRPDDFTSSIFPSNPFSERINRKAKDLPIFSSGSRTTGFRMAVIVGYEHVAAYLEEVQFFRAASKPTTQDAIHDDAIEDQVWKKLNEWLPALPEKGYFRTLGYCRQMRNSFAHGYGEPSKEFVAYARKHGHSLNKFWKNDVTELYGLDFQNVDAEAFTFDISFAFMNLFRICMREIDAMFASSFSLDDLLPIAVDKILARKPDLRKHPSRVASKARAAIETDYGEKFAASLMRQKIESLLLE